MLIKTIFERNGRWRILPIIRGCLIVNQRELDLDYTDSLREKKYDLQIYYSYRLACRVLNPLYEEEVLSFIVANADLIRFLRSLSEEKLKDTLVDIYTITSLLDSNLYNKFLQLNKLGCTSDTLEILRDFNVSEKLVKKLESFDFLIPIWLEGTPDGLIYVIVAANGDSTISATFFAGLNNRGLAVTRNFSGLENLADFILDSVYSPKLGLVDVGGGIQFRHRGRLVCLLQALLGDLQIGTIVARSKEHTLELDLFLPVIDYALQKPVNYLKSIGFATNFSKMINEILPYKLITKLRNGLPLTESEEENLAKFLEVAAAIIEVGTKIKRDYQDFQIMFLENFEVEKSGVFSQLPSSLKKQLALRGINKTQSFLLSNNLSLLVKSHKTGIYIFYKDARTVRWIRFKKLDLQDLKKEVLRRYYNYDEKSVD